MAVELSLWSVLPLMLFNVAVCVRFRIVVGLPVLLVTGDGAIVVNVVGDVVSGVVVVLSPLMVEMMCFVCCCRISQCLLYLRCYCCV